MSHPAGGQWWVVLHPDTGARAVALAVALPGGMMRWDMPRAQHAFHTLLPVFRVDVTPAPPGVLEWWVVVDPATRIRSTALLVPLPRGVGWEVPEHEDAVPYDARLPLFPVDSL